MTTTEWVERYNRAFEQAGAEGWSYESTLCLDSDGDWVDCRLGDFTPIPSNPSPFDPHAGLDHQATDERALKGKETPTFTAPEDGYYFIGGYKTFCEAGMEVRAEVANIPDPRMSTDTEIKELVPADETI